MVSLVASSRSCGPSQGAPRKKRYGCEVPRIFTPPIRELTCETTLGFACVEFARDVCGIDLYPWQKWLLVHMLELDSGLTVDTIKDRGRLDPIFRFRKVVVLVGRQNGKSTLSQVLALFFMYVLGVELVLGTAQDLDTAEEVWEGALDIIEETPELKQLAAHTLKVNGKKTIRLKTGERYKVKAANRRAGRGLSGDLILLDELREHQSWDAWAAVTKTTQARPAALILALSNAGDATSLVLRHLRQQAHEMLGDPDGICSHEAPSVKPDTVVDPDGDEWDLEDDDEPESLGLFEWSARPGCSRFDRDEWAQANPSMNYGIAERTIAGDAKSDPEWVFRTEVLCQWNQGMNVGPFPEGTWEAGTDRDSRIGDGSRVVFCVDVSADRQMAYVGVAGWRDDGRPHVEVVAARSGSEWVPGWFERRVDKYEGMTVCVQERGAPATPLIDELRKIEGLSVVPWGGVELGNGTARFYDAVKAWKGEASEIQSHRLFHVPQPVLDIAASAAMPRFLSDGGMAWDRRRSPVDIAPLVAVTGALWLLLQPVEEKTVSAYEDSELVFV